MALRIRPIRPSSGNGTILTRWEVVRLPFLYPRFTHTPLSRRRYATQIKRRVGAAPMPPISDAVFDMRGLEPQFLPTMVKLEGGAQPELKVTEKDDEDVAWVIRERPRRVGLKFEETAATAKLEGRAQPVDDAELKVTGNDAQDKRWAIRERPRRAGLKFKETTPTTEVKRARDLVRGFSKLEEESPPPPPVPNRRRFGLRGSGKPVWPPTRMVKPRKKPVPLVLWVEANPPVWRRRADDVLWEKDKENRKKGYSEGDLVKERRKKMRRRKNPLPPPSDTRLDGLELPEREVFLKPAFTTGESLSYKPFKSAFERTETEPTGMGLEEKSFEARIEDLLAEQRTVISHQPLKNVITRGGDAIGETLWRLPVADVPASAEAEEETMAAAPPEAEEEDATEVTASAEAAATTEAPPEAEEGEDAESWLLLSKHGRLIWSKHGRLIWSRHQRPDPETRPARKAQIPVDPDTPLRGAEWGKPEPFRFSPESEALKSGDDVETSATTIATPEHPPPSIFQRDDTIPTLGGELIPDKPKLFEEALNEVDGDNAEQFRFNPARDYTEALMSLRDRLKLGIEIRPKVKGYKLKEEWYKNAPEPIPKPVFEQVSAEKQLTELKTQAVETLNDNVDEEGFSLTRYTSNWAGPKDDFIDLAEEGAMRQPDQLRLYNDDGTRSSVTYKMSNSETKELMRTIGKREPKVDVSYAWKNWEDGAAYREAMEDANRQKHGLPYVPYEEEVVENKSLEQKQEEPALEAKDVGKPAPADAEPVIKQIRDRRADGSRGLIGYTGGRNEPAGGWLKKYEDDVASNIISQARAYPPVPETEATDAAALGLYSTSKDVYEAKIEGTTDGKAWSRISQRFDHVAGKPLLSKMYTPPEERSEEVAEKDDVETQIHWRPVGDGRIKVSQTRSEARPLIRRLDDLIARRVAEFITSKNTQFSGNFTLPLEGGDVVVEEHPDDGTYSITVPGGARFRVNPSLSPERTEQEKMAWKVAVTTSETAPAGFGVASIPTPDGAVRVEEEAAEDGVGGKYQVTLYTGAVFAVDIELGTVTEVQPLVRFTNADGVPLGAHKHRNVGGMITRLVGSEAPPPPPPPPPQQPKTKTKKAKKQRTPPRPVEGIEGDKALRFVELEEPEPAPFGAPQIEDSAPKTRWVAGTLEKAPDHDKKLSVSIRDKLREGREKEQHRRLDEQLRLLDTLLEEPAAANKTPTESQQERRKQKQDHLPASQRAHAPSLPLKFLEFFNSKKPTGGTRQYSTMADKEKGEGKKYKLVFTCPVENMDEVKEAVFETGAGTYPGGKYAKVSFDIAGKGQFVPVGDAKPAVGKVGEMKFVEEIRCEIFCISRSVATEAVKALIEAHPYEQVAYEVYEMVDVLADDGSVD